MHRLVILAWSLAALGPLFSYAEGGHKTSDVKLHGTDRSNDWFQRDSLDLVNETLRELEGADAERVKRLAAKEIQALIIIRSQLQAPVIHSGILNWFQPEGTLTEADQRHVRDLIKMLAAYVHELHELTRSPETAAKAAEQFRGTTFFATGLSEDELLQTRAALEVLESYRQHFVKDSGKRALLYGSEIDNQRFLLSGITNEELSNGLGTLSDTAKFMRASNALKLGYTLFSDWILTKSK